MILEQNYRKIAEYSQTAFKLYSRRYFANLMLEILQKKQNVKQLQKIQSQGNRLSNNFSQNQSEIDIINPNLQKQSERQNPYNKTMKNIDTFQAINCQNTFLDVSYLKYKDIVYLQIYNEGINPSDKSQRLRVYTELQSLKYRRFYYLSNDSLTKKRSAFQIVNPYEQNSHQFITGNSVFCLKSVFSGKHLQITKNIKMSEHFGYEIQFSCQINKKCVLSFKGVQSKHKKISTYEPLGIKTIYPFYLRAQGLEIAGNMEGSVFYFCKIIENQLEDIQPQFVKIKSITAQKFIGSGQIQMAKIMAKKSYANVLIEDENCIPIKQNQLNFATIDFNKITEAEITFQNFDQNSMKHIWMLNSMNQNSQESKQQQMKIVHACSNRGLLVKSDRSFKISSNLNQLANFSFSQHIQNFGIQKSLNQGNNGRLQRFVDKQMYKDNRFIHLKGKFSKISSKGQTIQIIYQNSNVLVTQNLEEQTKFQLYIAQSHNIGHYKVEQNKKKLFQVERLSQKQSKLIEELIQLQIVLKQVYQFVQKIGFIVDQRNQSLRFCVQQIKKYNIFILKYQRILNKILQKIHLFISLSHQSQISDKKLKNYMKQLKILQTLIQLSKIINLKIGKKKTFHQSEQPKDKVSSGVIIENKYTKNSQTPFQLFQILFQPIQFVIFETVYKLTINNEKCSNAIIHEASFFNKLLIFYPEKIGKILQEAIKNLSLFTTKPSNNDCNQLLQWAKLIQSPNEQNIRVQKTYIDIISEVVIDPKDRGIISYQNKCKQLLFNQRNKKKVIPRFGVEQQKPTIIFQTLSVKLFLENNPILAKFQQLDDISVSLYVQDFFQLDQQKPMQFQKHHQYIEYMISLIRLFRNLCKDKNKKLLKVVQDYGLTKDHLNHCLNSSKICKKLKMHYLSLYSVLFIDQDPFLSYDRRQSKCFSWSKINKCNLQAKTSLIFRQYTDLSMATQKINQFDAKIIPFIETYIIQSNKNLKSIIDMIKGKPFMEIKYQIQIQIMSFLIISKFLLQTINYGYLNFHQIKKFLDFVINHYEKLIQLKNIILIEETQQQGVQTNLFSPMDDIFFVILKIIEINEHVWKDLNSINLLKIFERKYSESKKPMTNLQFNVNTWKLLKHQMPFIDLQEGNLRVNKNYFQGIKKKTTTKNMFAIDPNIQSFQQKSNQQFDTNIRIFLLKMCLIQSQNSHKDSYSQLVQIISYIQKRNIHVYENLSSLLILNGKKQQILYRDYSGRTTGKILNVIKFYELMHKIKGSEFQFVDDIEGQKRIKQKIIELNNLINKIRRQMIQIKEEDMRLFKKTQFIIQKLNIDGILSQLLQYAHKTAYNQCITNLYKFYIEFIWENSSNKLKISKNFKKFMINFKIQKCPVLLSEIFQVLSITEKEQFIQHLFQKIHINQSNEDIQIKENILQILYRIIKTKQDNPSIRSIKSQLIFQIFKQNDYISLLSINNNLAFQYVNVLCLLGQACKFVYQKMRSIYSKTLLRNILYQQNKYSQRTVVLKLFYYFYIDQTSQLQNHQIDDILENLIFPELKHLPSVCQYSALQNLEIKENQLTQKSQKYEIDKNQNLCQEEIDILKKKFQDLILYEQNTILPTEQQKYWTFLYNSDDQNQMSLLNFTILLFKNQSERDSKKYSGQRKKNKSVIYQTFFKYLNDLCDFLKGAFSKSNNEYQRKITNKIEEILIIHQENHQNKYKSVYPGISKFQKQFLKKFFGDFSQIIIKQGISYNQIIESAQVKREQLNRRRTGQNVQKLILEQDFIRFVEKLSFYVSNVKQFRQYLAERKVTIFFKIYRCDKARKMNIYKFLEKLFEYLESIKNQKINKMNENLDINQKQMNLVQNKKQNTESYKFVNEINESKTIDEHFKVFIKKFEVNMKFFLQQKWIHQNQQLLQAVFKEIKNQEAKLKQKWIQRLNVCKEQVGSNSQGQRRLNLLQGQLSNYNCLKKWCEGTKISLKNKHQNGINCFQNNILEIHNRYYRKSSTFSRLILTILKQINLSNTLFIWVDKQSLQNHIAQQFQQNKSQLKNTQICIIFQLIKNFNNGVKYNFRANRDSLQRFYPSNYKKKNKQNNSLCSVIYRYFIAYLEKESYNLQSLNDSFAKKNENNDNSYIQNMIPFNINSKIQILRYGFKNKLIDLDNYTKIQLCLIKIIQFWSKSNCSFSDSNWFEILQQIFDMVDKNFNNTTNFAFYLSTETDYSNKFCLLVQNCCRTGFKTTNINSLIQIKLLKLLIQINIKFYLQNNKHSLGKILNLMNFQLLTNSIQLLYAQSLQPKLKIYQNQEYCQIESMNSKICSYQVCNQQKITHNDQNIMQIFVNFLILIQLSISLHNHNFFKNPLKVKDLRVLEKFQQILKLQDYDIVKQNLTKMNCLHFYKRFIGLVYLYTQEKSLMSLHFKIPYVQRYCTKTMKEELMYYVRQYEKGKIGKYMNSLSKYLQCELQQRKSYDKYFILPYFINYKSKMQIIIIILAFIRLSTLFFTSWGIEQITFYPFISFMIFLKVLYVITQIKKAINVINLIYEKKKLTLMQKAQIIYHQNALLSLSLVLAYSISFQIPQIAAIIVFAQLYNLRFCHRISFLMVKVMSVNVSLFMFCLFMIAVFFGIANSQSDLPRSPINVILQAFKQFQMFMISNLKVTTQTQFTVSKQYPLSFLLYLGCFGLIVFRTLKCFYKELRVYEEQKITAKQRCIICQKKSSQMQKSGTSFEQHTSMQHNFWHYLYFFIYLRRKSAGRQNKDMKSIEIHVNQSLKQQNFQFIGFNKR